VNSTTFNYFRKGQVYESNILTTCHIPTTESETKRIKSAGGKVWFGRVDGILAVSRAFGDAQQKDYVTADPDITPLELEYHHK
jgi:serine/threonine protein phosphatase PrpC